jgi:4a-hydroxytetrahydrobiopterin dehydratase
MAQRLTAEEIEAGLTRLRGWRATEDGFIQRDWALGDFDRAMDFINRVADIARSLDHHPNLSNVYDRVSLALQTHDAGGVTAKDLAFASRVDALGID